MLEGKRALITGASSGIGRATAILMARDGATVGVTGRNEEALRELAEELGKSCPKPVVLPGDITDAADCERIVAGAVSAMGGLDILVNAAGIIGSGTIENTTPDAWRRMFDINVDAVFRLMSLAVPHLIASRGNVVNVSSVTGTRAFPGVLAYCASKAAVDQLTHCAALELASKGVRVNAVNPGVVVSNLHRRSGMDEEKYRAFLEHSRTTHPIGRVGQPDDVAHLIVFLASERAGWITGGSFPVDGGRHQTCAR
jgi:NAD(P)-dependent dehydrogenase (short-subunit alcohol dehydrogenase family)